VRKSKIYLGILGNEYGNIVKGGLSVTESELREAQGRDKKVFIYIKGSDDSKRETRVKEIVRELQKPDSRYKYKRFNTIVELKERVFESLVDFLRDEGIVGRVAFDQSVCEGADFKDIDEQKVRWFLRTAKKKRNYPFDENTPVKEVFAHLNLLNNGKLTNAAILLFSNNLKKFHLFQAEIKCLQLSGTEIKKPFPSYQIYDTNLFEQIDKAVAFVLDSIRLPVIQQEGTAQVKRPPEIPEFAIHEAIVNAVAHRDYNSSAGVQVMVFIDRVEIWDPGVLSDRLTIELLKKPHASYPKNPLLAEVLFWSNYIQKAGSGILEMIEQCKLQGLPGPEFQQESEFRTILSRDIFTESILFKLGLSDRQIQAVKYVKEKGRITNREYRRINSVSDETGRLELRELITKRVLKSKGRGRSASYIIGD